MKSKLWQTVLSTRYSILLIGCLVSGCSAINFAITMIEYENDDTIYYSSTLYLPDKHKPDIMVDRYYESHVTQLTAAIKKDPTNVDAYVMRAELYLAAAEHSKAIDDFMIAKKILDSKNYQVTTDVSLISSHLTSLYIYRGIDYWYTGERYLAVKDYTAALEIDPDNWEAMFHRWQAYKYQGYDYKAERDRQEGMKLNPEKFNQRYTFERLNYRLHSGGVI